MAQPIVSFKDWKVPCKNPAAGGQVIERQADRVIIHTREQVDRDDIQALAQVIKANGEIGPALVSTINLTTPSGLECNQRLAGIWQSARDTGPSAQVIKMVEEILARKAG